MKKRLVLFTLCSLLFLGIPAGAGVMIVSSTPVYDDSEAMAQNLDRAKDRSRPPSVELDCGEGFPLPTCCCFQMLLLVCIIVFLALSSKSAGDRCCEIAFKELRNCCGFRRDIASESWSPLFIYKSLRSCNIIGCFAMVNDGSEIQSFRGI